MREAWQHNLRLNEQNKGQRITKVWFSRISEKMSCMWYMDTSDIDQREPHRPIDGVNIGVDQLASLGVLYWKVSLRHAETTHL